MAGVLLKKKEVRDNIYDVIRDLKEKGRTVAKLSAVIELIEKDAPYSEHIIRAIRKHRCRFF